MAQLSGVGDEQGSIFTPPGIKALQMTPFSSSIASQHFGSIPEMEQEGGDSRLTQTPPQ